MTPDLPPDDVDQQIRINELKHRAEGLAGGEMTCFENPDSPPDVVETFWDRVVKYEEAEWTSEFEQMAKAGYVLPHLDELTTYEQVHAALWELIRQLAARRTYLSNTDHLSDRELYEYLVFESLHEAWKDVDIPDMTCHLDILGGCSEEDMQLYLRYYADDEWRERWAKDLAERQHPTKRETALRPRPAVAEGPVRLSRAPPAERDGDIPLRAPLLSLSYTSSDRPVVTTPPSAPPIALVMRPVPDTRPEPPARLPMIEATDTVVAVEPVVPPVAAVSLVGVILPNRSDLPV